MSNKDMNQMNQKSSSKKKVIHFSDGSTMEVGGDEGDQTDKMQQEPEMQREPGTDPKKLSWPEWLKHYSHKGSTSVMNGLEYSGETLAYYLGITAPKYQHEIDEYNRVVAKKAKDEAEAKAWASTNPSSVPIVMDPVRTVSSSIDSKGENREQKYLEQSDAEGKV